MANSKEKRDAFIKTFVNQMYGILIGIGIGSILFDSNFDISKWYNIVMIIFVTSIVLIYWWDWIGAIEGDVVSTKSELIIDFVILIVLEMLFVYYARPLYLAISLILLSLADLVWVINYMGFNRKKRDAYNCKASYKKWIFEKIFSITIYSILLTLVVLVLPLLNGTNAELFTVVIFVCSFVLVRKVSFNQVHQSKLYTVRVANDRDGSDILIVNNDYFDSGSLKLMKKYSLKEVIALIEEKRVKVALDSNQKLVGYSVITQNGALNYLNETVFEDQKIKTKLKKGQHVLVEQIAVASEYTREGIGTLLIDDIISTYKQTLLSFVSIEPFLNEASIDFHQRNGFIHVGDFHADTFMNRKNYSSYLYMHNQLNSNS